MRQFVLISSTVILMVAGVMAGPGYAQTEHDWPQWRGPNRDDVSKETGLLKQWPDGGPPQLWLFQDAGAGYSGFAIVDQRLFTMGADEENEFLLCLDANTGKEIWRQTVGARFNNPWGDGPRSTPTINDGHAYVLSANGNVCCLRIDDGSKVWEQSLTDFGGKVPYWGYSESVLVDGDQVVCTPGGSEGAVIAFDAKTGERKWQSVLFTDPAHYTSLVIADHPEKRHYVVLSMKSVSGIDPENGNQLWREDWPGRTAVIPTPIYDEQKVYVTSGYGVGSKLLDISEWESPDEVWFNKVMKNHHGGVILLGGHLYGYSDGGGWTCQDLETGQAVWTEKDGLGKGAIGYADDRLYLVAENSGEVVLIDASPDGWNERGRFTLNPQSENRKRSGKIWVHPVVCNGKLFLRDQEIIYCFDVKQ